MISSQAYVFETPLIEGVVIKRNSQFTMTIEAEGQNAKAHCPTTTRIGDIDIAGRPCLLSKSKDPNSENAANRYVEHFLRNGGFSDIVGYPTSVQREVFLK